MKHNKRADKLFHEAIDWMQEYTEKNKEAGVLCPISIARALGMYIYHTSPDDLKGQAISVTMQEMCEAFNSNFEYEAEQVS